MIVIYCHLRKYGLNHHAINWKNTLFRLGHFQARTVTNCQRVPILEKIEQAWINRPLTQWVSMTCGVARIPVSLPTSCCLRLKSPLLFLLLGNFVVRSRTRSIVIDEMVLFCFTSHGGSMFHDRIQWCWPFGVGEIHVLYMEIVKSRPNTTLFAPLFSWTNWKSPRKNGSKDQYFGWNSA